MNRLPGGIGTSNRQGSCEIRITGLSAACRPSMKMRKQGIPGPASIREGLLTEWRGRMKLGMVKGREGSGADGKVIVRETTGKTVLNRRSISDYSLNC